MNFEQYITETLNEGIKLNYLKPGAKITIIKKSPLIDRLVNSVMKDGEVWKFKPGQTIVVKERRGKMYKVKSSDWPEDLHLSQPQLDDLIKRKQVTITKDTSDKDDKKLNEGLKQARKNVGAETCWDGYRVDGTKKNDKGEEVPNCVPKNESIETVGKPKFDVDTYVVYDIGEDKYEVRISKVSKKKYTLSDILKNGEEEKGTLSKPVEWIDTNAKVLK